MGLEYAAGGAAGRSEAGQTGRTNKTGRAEPQIAAENAVKLAEAAKEAEIYKGLYYHMLELVAGGRA